MRRPWIRDGTLTVFEYHGMLMTITELAWATRIPESTLRRRLIAYGWPVERATSQPVRRYRFKGRALAR